VVATHSDERWDDVVAAISSIHAQRCPPIEVIVVVDHNEELLNRLLAADLGAMVIPNAGRKGLSGARNTGVASSKGEIVAFLDDDASAEEDWLCRLVAPYVDATVIGVGGSSVPRWDVSKPAWFPDEFAWVVGCSYVGLPTSVRPVRNLIGSNMSFRRDAFRIAGLFTETMGRVGSKPVGCEETEFCIRLQHALPGAVLLYEPRATVQHRVRAERGTLQYFFSRCFAEGWSKALVAKSVGSKSALATERRYAAEVLPRGVLRSVQAAFRQGDSRHLGAAGAIAAGFGSTLAGYVAGTVGARRPR
jgi:glycosyltransferase involved in cell wall biosynthesis